jgi:hypothetical protein
MKGKITWDNLEGDGRIILKWILMKEVVGMWSGFVWLRTGYSGGHL